jgi:hypothetical protein
VIATRVGVQKWHRPTVDDNVVLSEWARETDPESALVELVARKIRLVVHSAPLFLMRRRCPPDASSAGQLWASAGQCHADFCGLVRTVGDVVDIGRPDRIRC